MSKKILFAMFVVCGSILAVVGFARMAFAATSTAQIAFPQDKAKVSGTVEFQGTAAGPDFYYYKVEFAWPGSGEWVLVDNTIHYDAVTNGVLATADTTKIADGEYAVRLLVSDKDGQYNTSQITVTVNNKLGPKRGTGPERGCMACHVVRDAKSGFPSLYFEARLATNGQHPTFSKGFDATYADCMLCHASSGVGDRGVAAPLSLRAIVHPAHMFSKIFTQIEYDGNCFSCHNVNAEGGWDVLSDAMLVNEKGVPISIPAAPTVIPPTTPGAQ